MTGPLHFANLSRGLLRKHLDTVAASDLRSAGQSTSCEQQRWPDIVTGAGPELLMAMVRGVPVIIQRHLRTGPRDPPDVAGTDVPAPRL